jgi:hypothetical protein
MSTYPNQAEQHARRHDLTMGTDVHATDVSGW